MRKSIHLLHGMIFPILASWIRTSNTANPKTSIRSGVKRREQTAKCIGWPPEDPGLLLIARDGSAPLCGTANDLLIDTWNVSAEPNTFRRRMDFPGSDRSTIVDVPDNGLGIDCLQYPKAQIVQLLQVSSQNAVYDEILECAAYKGPHVAFISPPPEEYFPVFQDDCLDDQVLDDFFRVDDDIGSFDGDDDNNTTRDDGIGDDDNTRDRIGGDDDFCNDDIRRAGRGSSISTKDGLALQTEKFYSCVVTDDCITPDSFQIYYSLVECRVFFDLLDTTSPNA